MARSFKLAALMLACACVASTVVVAQTDPACAAVTLSCEEVSVNAQSDCGAPVPAADLATVTVNDIAYSVEGTPTFTANPASPYTVAASPTTVAVSASVQITNGGAPVTCPLSCATAKVTVVDAEVANATLISCGFGSADTTVATVKPGPVTFKATYDGVKANGCPVEIAISTDGAKCERCVGSVKNGKARAKAFKCKAKVAEDNELSSETVRVIAGPGVGARLSWYVVAKSPAGDVSKLCGLCVARKGSACVDPSWQAGQTATCVPKINGGGNGNGNGGGGNGNGGNGNGNGNGRRMLAA